jgi:L-fucose isomerase-like protein
MVIEVVLQCELRRTLCKTICCGAIAENLDENSTRRNILAFHKQTTIGLCPIGKIVFSHEDAMRIKRQIQEKFSRWHIDYVDLDGILLDGMVRDQKHVETAVRFFQDRHIDALFLPHCNFGTEGAAAMIAKQCGVPTLLWGPRDGAPMPDGTRLRDSLCGMFATSGVLYNLRVPFTYLDNCCIDDADFQKGVDRFVRAVRVVKTMRTMRIGQVGQRLDTFWSTIANESDLLERFGIQVLPIDLTNLIHAIRDRIAADHKKYEEELAGFRQWISFNQYHNDDEIFCNFAFRDLLLERAHEEKLDGFCVQTVNSIQKELHSTLSLGLSLISEERIPTVPESDLYGTISSVLIESASATEDRSFLPDIVSRHPENQNAVLLWHAAAPLSLRVPNSPVKIDVPWILKGLPTGLVHFKLKDGPLTVCRFAGDSGGYRLGCGEGHTVEGPYTQEFYAWMEVTDWPTWERQLVTGPYIHHVSCCYDHCSDVLEEAARYIPNLQFERFGSPQGYSR